jgi:hypothetical protein
MQKFGGGIGVSFIWVPWFVPLRAIVSRHHDGYSELEITAEREGQSPRF